MASDLRYKVLHHRTNENLDRFIPNRAAMDFGYAHYMLTEGWKEKHNPKPLSLSEEAFQKRLKEACGMNRSRIFSFCNKPPAPLPSTAPPDIDDSPTARRRPRFRHIPQTSDRVMDCPDLLNDYYLNLFDWGESNYLAVALTNTVYLWDATTNSTTELMSVSDSRGPVTSLSWAHDGDHIAVGLDNSTVQLWDASAGKKLRTLRGRHEDRIGSLAWNGHILTTGSADSRIINNDVRVRDHAVETFRGHELEVCGLKWSPSGRYLASGGNDNLVHIFDRAMTSSDSANRCLQRIQGHRAAVKALAWCPFRSNMLASGGGTTDHCIKFWNIHSGACLNSVDTGSQVTGLLWSKNDRELLSSHGFPDNKLTLWNYPSMVKMAELFEHTSRVLYMCQSPDGSSVASGGGDETLRIWNVFRNTEARPSKGPEPFAHVSRIR